MIDAPNINRQCKKCGEYNKVSLETDFFVCTKCGKKNKYNLAELKEAMAEIRRKIKKEQFKNPKNN